jgi:hypothetical protein
VSSGTVLWTFSGDGTLQSAPIVASSSVYVGTASGKVYGLSLGDGKQRWVGAAGAPVRSSQTWDNSTTPGMAAANGMLVAAATDRLVAFGAPARSTVVAEAKRPATRTRAAMRARNQLIGRVLRRGIAVRLVCRATCRAQLAVRLARRTGRPSSRKSPPRRLRLGRVVGRRTVVLRGTRRVAIQLDAAARRRLATLQRADAVVIAHMRTGGRTFTRRAVVRLRRAR